MGGGRGSDGPGGRRDRPDRESRPAPMVLGRAQQASRRQAAQERRMTSLREAEKRASREFRALPDNASRRAIDNAVRTLIRASDASFLAGNPRMGNAKAIDRNVANSMRTPDTRKLLQRVARGEIQRP